MNPATTIPTPALVLGVGGLLPFILGALLIWLGPSSVWQAWGGLVLLSYGAVILSFIGAVHWGMGLKEWQQQQEGSLWPVLGWSVTPALVAWAALLLPPKGGLALLLLGFAAQYAVDRRTVAVGRLPAWYGRLRSLLTAGAVICLLAGWAA